MTAAKPETPPRFTDLVVFPHPEAEEPAATVRLKDGSLAIVDRQNHRPIGVIVTWETYQGANRDVDEFAVLKKRVEASPFQDALRDLCRTIPDPPRKPGRPPHAVGDVVYAMVLMVYLRVSGRKLHGILAEAYRRGDVTRVPHFNALYRYFREPLVTPVLHDLVTAHGIVVATVDESARQTPAQTRRHNEDLCRAAVDVVLARIKPVPPRPTSHPPAGRPLKASRRVEAPKPPEPRPAPSHGIDLSKYEGLVRQIAGQQGAPHPVADSEQYADGWLGLVEAARRFKPELGHAFITYACYYIRGYMLRGRKIRLGKGNRQSRVGVVPFSQLGPSDADGDFDPTETRDLPIDDREQCDLLLRCLDRRTRRLVERVTMQGYTLKEAGRMERPPITRERVRQVIAKGMKKLRQAAGCGEDEGDEEAEESSEIGR